MNYSKKKKIKKNEFFFKKLLFWSGHDESGPETLATVRNVEVNVSRQNKMCALL